LRRRFSLLMFLYYATVGALVPLFSLRLQELYFTPLEMGWTCATQALAGLAAPLVAGQIADRWLPAERCLSLYACLSGILLWILAELSSPLAVFSTSLALWLVLSPASTLCAAMSFAHLPQPARDFGPVRMWGTVAWVVSGWVVGYGLSNPAWLCSCLTTLRAATPHFELADAFRFAGLLALVLGAYALTLPHTPPLRRPHSWLAPLAALRLLRDRPFAVYWICSFGVCVTIPFTIQVLPLLLKHLGIVQAWISPTLTLGQSMEIGALALLPMFLLRLNHRGTMLLGLGAWALLLAVLTLGEPVWLVVSSWTLNGLCICCFIVAGQVFVNGRARGEIRVSAQALLTFINGLGMLTGNVLVGWVRELVDGQFVPTFAVAAAIGFVLVIAFFVAFRGAEVEPSSSAVAEKVS
jgi:MFS family permease